MLKHESRPVETAAFTSNIHFGSIHDLDLEPDIAFDNDREKSQGVHIHLPLLRGPVDIYIHMFI